MNLTLEQAGTLGALAALLCGAALWLWKGGAGALAARMRAQKNVTALGARMDRQIASVAASLDTHVQLDEVKFSHLAETLRRIEERATEDRALAAEDRKKTSDFRHGLDKDLLAIRNYAYMGADVAQMIQRRQKERAEHRSNSARVRALRDVQLPGEEGAP